MFYMFVLDETHVRGVKLIYGCFLVINVQEIIPKDHHRILKEGHKNHCAGCPRQTLVTEQSTFFHGCDALLWGRVVWYIPKGEWRKHGQPL